MRRFIYLLFMIVPLLSIIVVSVWAGERSLSQLQTRETHKVVAQPGEVDPDALGVTLLADYGTYQLFSVADSKLHQINSQAEGDLFVADEMNVIEINGHLFDTQSETTPQSLMPAHLPTGHALQLIQFVGPIKDEWLAAVRATGSEPVHYIANNAYLVWTDENGRSQLNTLNNQETYLQFSAPFQPDLKVSPELVEWMGNGRETAVVPVVIQMVQHPGQIASEAIIQDRLMTQTSSWQPVLKFQTIMGTMRQSDVAEIAQLPDVYWMGLQQPRELMDEVQGQIVAGNVMTTSAYSAVPTGPGYLTWLDSYGFSQNRADYPIVDITDDGIGNGNTNGAAGDVTFRELGSAANASRLAYLGNCTVASNSGGIGGHGHLNLSIAGGYDTRSGFPYRDDDGYQLGLGINPYGRFAGTRVFYEDAFLGTTWSISACGDGTDAALIKQNHDSGAQISNNSWGNTSTSYGPSAQAYDIGVRDADGDEAGNQELIYIFSAGNQGNSGTIGNPATAKNVITVGASENYRPYDIDGCNKGPTAADDVMDIAAFSSRGPAVGGRVKPELVAPGSHVQATASTNFLFSGSTVCGGQENDGNFPAGDAFYPSDQSVFTWSSGTSHAAPAVAGIASLYYYWLENTYQLDTPSPALMKAYLIAHTLYLTGARANDTLPSNAQGYGLPDMSLGLDNASRVFLDQQVIFGNSGDTWTKDIVAADPTKPLRIVLAYTDAPGALGSNPKVNDLNLRLDTTTDTYLGNHFQWEWSIPDGEPDSNNNYEAIFLPMGETGTLALTVTAFNIAGDGVPSNGDVTDQDFALVCYNCAEFLEVTPASQTVCTMSETSVAYEVTAVSASGAGEVITYSATNLPSGTTAGFSPNPAIYPASSTFTISDLDTAPAGNYLIDIQGVSTVMTRTAQAELELIAQSPGAPSLNFPADGASVESGSVFLTWDAAALAETYSIEIATDSAFTNIIESATGLTETNYQTANLVMNQTYYWRVSGNNGCGEGVFSQTFSFFMLICENCADLVVMPESQAVCMLPESRAEYVLTAVTQPGFDEETTYSAVNLPPGTTAVFNPNPATLPLSSTLTISDLADSVAGSYTIDIQGVSSVMTRTAQAELELFSQNPESSLLNLPVNGASVPPGEVVLTWDASFQAQTYSVEIAADSSFTNMIESATELTETHYQTGNLPPNATYYWRVSGNNSCGSGSFSTAFAFSTWYEVFLPAILKD